MLVLMQIRVAGSDDVGHLAELLATFAESDEPAGTGQRFAPDLLRWWTDHRDSHVAFLALLPSGDVVGMAWLAVTARVPRPGGAALATRHGLIRRTVDASGGGGGI
jgi:hypothetical protein